MGQGGQQGVLIEVPGRSGQGGRGQDNFNIIPKVGLNTFIILAFHTSQILALSSVSYNYIYNRHIVMSDAWFVVLCFLPLARNIISGFLI